MEFTVNCTYCEDDKVLFRVASAEGQDEAQFRAAWKATTTSGPGGGPQYQSILCSECGADYQIVDDGVPLGEGGFVEQKDVSKPKITGLTITGGPRTGGNAIYIQGIAMDVGAALTVKFGPNTCATVDNRQPTQARVVVPRGCYNLSIAEGPYIKLRLSDITGTLSVDENFSTDGGATGVIRRVETDYYWIILATQTPVESLPGMILTGGVGGGYGTIQTAEASSFQAGEEVRGLTSNASAVFRSGTWVDNPTGAFAPSEFIYSLSTRVYAKLGPSPAYSGLVSVSAENDYGQRSADQGGVLTDAYTYA